ncbi:MAG: glycosyltransferase family 39 protein [Chloroflexus sp.]
MVGLIRHTLNHALGWATVAVLIITLLGQLPMQTTFDIGRTDAAVVQGFGEPETGDPSSDGMVRRALPTAALRIPHVGAPATLTIRWMAPAGTPVLIAVNDEAPIQLLARGGWEEHSFTITSGWRKAFDLVVRITTPAPTASVWLDRVTLTATPPLWPYPAQLGYAALIGALIGSLLAQRPRWQPLIAIGGYGLLWLVLYRISSYPIRYLPAITVVMLGAIWFVWRWPQLATYWPPAVTPLLAVGVAVGWMIWLIPAMQAHVTLARPGVENDFRVFATRDTIATIFQADGFYNLGYPLLLWLVRPLTFDNPFLAGRLIALISGGLLIGGSYLLARCFLAPAPALLTTVFLAWSGMVVQYGLLVGSDMPFAVAFTFAVALTLHAGRSSTGWMAVLAGVLAGFAFLIRHPGMLLLVWGAATLWYLNRRRAAFLFVLGFGLAAAPQLVVNTVQTGQPLFNQQAKNIWLAVYANTDWQRWDEVPNSISLLEVVGRDPIRFFTNWSRNIVGFLGAGAEDVSEFGRADQLRLLGWPTNWLAIGGLVVGGWLAWHKRTDRCWLALLALIGLYVAAISVAFILPRFWLPLVPLYAVAAAWALTHLLNRPRSLLAAGLGLIVLLWPGPQMAVSAVLTAQPSDETGAVALVQQTITTSGARVVAAIPDRLPLVKYSAIAHLITERVPLTVTFAELQALHADYVLWDNAQGEPPLPTPNQRRIGDGRFTLYRVR